MLSVTRKLAFRPFMTDGLADGPERICDHYFSNSLRVRYGRRAAGQADPLFPFAGIVRGIRSCTPKAVLRRLSACVFRQRETVDAFAETILRSLGISDKESIVFTDPNTAVVTSRDSIMRIPFDRTSEARCRHNTRILAALETTPVAGFVPRPLGSGRACSLSYYRESRLPGAMVNGTGKGTRSLTRVAADFMTAFHLQTAHEIIIDGRHFHRLFARDMRRLDAYLTDTGRMKRESLERSLRRRFLYTPCKTVWFHGDCTIANLLFDPSSRQVRGVTGWSFARRNGLPLLDIFSLLIHAKSRSTRRPLEEVFRERCFVGRWDHEEGVIVDRYVSLLHLPREYVRPLLVMFWVHYTARCLGQQRPDAVPESVRNDIDNTLEAALDVLGSLHVR